MADSSPLQRIHNAVQALNPDQHHEQRNISLTICAIRHYVLDSSSANILFKAGTKNQVVPFDGYDLAVADDQFVTIIAVADLRISSLIQKQILRIGSVISRISVRLCHSERMSHHQFLFATNLVLDQQKTAKADLGKLSWFPVFEENYFSLPLLSQRLNFISIWNVTDPIGASWDSPDDVVTRVTDSKQVPRRCCLTQVVTNQAAKNNSPIIARVFAKSRLNYYAGKKAKRLDLNPCPYQFDVLVGDNQGCCLAVFWGELAVQLYKMIDIGTTLLIRSYRLKQAYKHPEYSACCFSPKLERFGVEISVSEKLINGLFPIDIIQSNAILPAFPLPSVPFNFLSINSLVISPSSISDIKLDFAGVVVYLGRWRREARRYFRSLNENDPNSTGEDDSKVEGVVVSSISGEKYLEEYHSGGYWMWRWLMLADDSSDHQIIRLKYYGTSQPDVQYQVKPGDPIAVTQLKFVVLNKSDAIDSKFDAAFCLTTTNESQMVNLATLEAKSSFIREERVVKVLDYSRNLPTNLKSKFVFGGVYDYPTYPATFQGLIERFQAKPNDSAMPIFGPVYVSASQLEAVLDQMVFMESRCVVIHGLLAAARFIPLHEVITRTSNYVGKKTSSPTNILHRKPSRKRKPAGNVVVDNFPTVTFASAWQERRLNFRAIGVDHPHWRSLAWYWQAKSAESILKKCVNPPNEMDVDFSDEMDESKLNINPLANFAGALVLQISLLNQSAYTNCIIPVPMKCCNADVLKAGKMTSEKLINLANQCCDIYQLPCEASEIQTNVTKAVGNNITLRIRQYFSSMGQTRPNAAAAVPAKVSAILNCYGLGADGVELNIRHLYPIV